ncbi:hypothetical protein EEB14_49465 [Rhodococcus sp. WS4]|nr:hypothetical protein EEB14_49465 [Rhodococcus sp. WS4]
MKNPLWVIGLLLGLCELVLGAAASLTSGWVQGLFAIFMVGYTSAVTATFFYLLLTRAHVFYGPGEYRGGATLEEYAKTVARSKLVSSTAEAVFSSVERTLTAKDLSRQEVATIIESVRDEVEKSVISVDLSALEEGLGTVMVPTSQGTTVATLLDTIWYSTPDSIPPRSYPRFWLLRRLGDGKEFKDIGSEWARSNGQGGFDRRRLEEVGIGAGDEFEVLPGPTLRATQRIKARRDSVSL